MPRVDFVGMSPARYEDMVSVLLSRVRQTQRVDGSGGDGGRDCYFSDEHGTDAYELKSFTGRMSNARRQQVARSLRRALGMTPRTWSLVVPIDPTPREQQWFDSLAGTTTTLRWLGRTWLEDQLAAYPDIGRYFAGASEEVVQILTDIAREDALPSDAAGVALRMTGLVARLNEIDPYYAFDFTIAEGRTAVSCRPRYPDALRDRPISFSAQLRLDDATPPSLRAAIDDFLLYGSPVQIPAENIGGLSIEAPGGLGSQFAGGGIAVDGSFAAPDVAGAPVPGAAGAARPAGQARADDGHPEPQHGPCRRPQAPSPRPRWAAVPRRTPQSGGVDLQREPEVPVRQPGVAQGRRPGPCPLQRHGRGRAAGDHDP
jgi:hypothetical protein